MIELTLGATDLERWLHQNKAVPTGDFVEGTLLDNFVVWCKRGVAAIYERYLNEWSSGYRIEFQTGAAETVWANWYKFEQNCAEG